jgi:hypothetical protein
MWHAIVFNLSWNIWPFSSILHILCDCGFDKGIVRDMVSTCYRIYLRTQNDVYCLTSKKMTGSGASTIIHSQLPLSCSFSLRPNSSWFCEFSFLHFSCCPKDFDWTNSDTKLGQEDNAERSVFGCE